MSPKSGLTSDSAATTASEIVRARSDAEILDCFDVMVQLRPHLRREEFVARIRAQFAEGYALAALRRAGRCVVVAGYRFGTNLAWGRYLYVDDLVTDEHQRSQGAGREIFDWLVQEARAHDCDQFHLDSGVQRLGAHRFYLLKRMDITSHHFGLKLR